MTNCCKPVLWENHFDNNGLLEMTLANSTQSPVQGWQLRPQSPISQSPQGVLWYGDPNTNNFDFVPGQPSSGTATLPFMQIGAAAALKFFVYYDCEAGAQYDQFNVTITDAAGKKTTLYTKGVSPPEGMQMWLPIYVPLDAYKGQTVQIQFFFNTFDGIGNAGQGVFIDDVVISQSCGTGPPTP